jgi:hypothetical protein
MVDVQLFLNAVLIVLVIILIGVAVYLVIVLRDLRETILRANTVLDDVQKVTGIVTNPVTSLTAIGGALMAGLKAFKPSKNSSDKTEEI